jgi:hypothetical protein
LKYVSILPPFAKDCDSPSATRPTISLDFFGRMR